MAEKEIKRVITIESSESLNTLNNLNARIKELKGTMGDLDITTEEYRQVSEEVTQLENVKRNAIRGVTAAVEGSYNAYSKELSILQKHRKTLNENTQEYEEMTKRVAELQQKLKDMDADVGVYSRNVGNYSSAFNGLQGSVNQVMRELPVLSMGLDRFVLAISNNLPILFDSIKAYKEMAASQNAAAVASHAMAAGERAATKAT
jgi:DNA repair exonuclease SbcCD ATPase subunit